MGNPFRPLDTQGASFLPEDYVRRRAEMRANFISLGLFGVVMFGVIGAFFVTNRQWLSIHDEQLAINAQWVAEAKKIDQLEQIEKQKTEMIGKAELTTALLEKVPRSILLAELITRMPQEITLLELALTSKRVITEGAPQPEKKGAAKAKTGSLSKAGAKAADAGGADKSGAASKSGDAKGAPAEPDKPAAVAPKFEYTLRLQGVARVNNDITDYLAGLTACPLLGSVELTYIKAKTINETDLREFEITARIRNDADARSINPVRPEDLERGLKAASGKPAPAPPGVQVTAVPEAPAGKE